jgi:hypothetical protein
LSREERFSLLAVLLALVTCAGGFSVPAHAAGAAYYIDDQAGSNCSDSGPHTLAQPWCTFTPINAIKTFAPGDQILLARGGTWNQQMTLAGSGTSTEPIILSAYGRGANPRILRSQGTSDICVLITNPNYWNISNLEVGQASVGILLHYTRLSNHGITISNVYAHDNKGIWSGFSTKYPVSGKTRDPFASSLNINLSSGVLFNLDPKLAFNSSQYVLKGVSVSNIRGAGNLDSVSFNAETDTTDKQDGHNAFQDVTLNGLFLSGDNGHAAAAYQAAGLGCSDSLRLIGMTNVTVLNSVLYNEAACHTPTGTAAVILDRVSNVTFVNNILFGVPPSDSPDETAIDLEWSESHVDLQANLFAGNAGAGVEILNIHPGDHSDDIRIHDNTFANNSRTFNPGASSIWEYNKGSGYATPSGLIENNLYIEPNGRFFAGENIGSMTSRDNLSALFEPSFAAEQFSSTQGKNQWQYMYESSGSTWTNIPRFTPVHDNGAWEMSPTQYVSAFNLAPAGCAGSCDTGGVARVWVAPYRGTVSVRGRVLKSDARGGDGVYAVINLVSGRNVTQIWPATGGKQLVGGADRVGYATNLDNISVAPGDMIRFEVSAKGDNSYDATSWTPSVAYVSDSYAFDANRHSLSRPDRLNTENSRAFRRN